MKARKLRLLAVMLSALMVFNTVIPAYAEPVETVMEEELADDSTNVGTNADLKDTDEEPVKEASPSEAEPEDEDIVEEDSNAEEEIENDLASPADAEYDSASEELEEEIASPSEAEYDTVLTWEGDGLKVTMTAPEGAFDAPEGVTLSLEVEPIVNEDLDKLLNTLEEEQGVKKEADEVIAYDIRVMGDDGNEYQPKKPVTVVFTDIVAELAAVSDAVTEDMTKDSLDIYHFDSEGKNSELVTELKEQGLPEGVEVSEEDIATEITHNSPWIIVPASSLGDLWAGWDAYAADAYKPNGYGTESDPYEIANVANLMWLSISVAKGTSGVADAWYVLSSDLDLSAVPSSCGDWHPIGWYCDKSSPANYKAFKGHFDGNGHTISGLEIIETTGFNLQNVGLFGVLDGAEIKNLSVEAGTVNGYDYVGILAGQILGASDIHYVKVSGTANCGISTTGASASAHVGGIAGNVNGTSLSANGAAVLENCKAMNVSLNSTGANSTVGGIAGTAAKAYIVDSYVLASSAHGIQGLGYVGGIVGYQSATDIYNSYVDGTIGGNGSIAAGGVTGQFYSGEIYLVQMNGEIGSTNLATTHEGIIVGTRIPSSTFVYGTNSSDNAGYLYYSADVKGKALNGSGISGDADGAAQSAHTGFWTNNELKYTIVEGSNEHPCAASRYYYEELEDGVRFIVTSKLGKQFTVQDYADGLRFAIDHYAPGPNGAPVDGHLVSIPQINSQNSVDLDVAYFEAVAGDGSLFYKVMDKDSAAAVAPGTIVKVTSSAKNIPAQNKYFQRVVDETVNPEKVVRPTYTDASSGTTEEYDMDYQTGGSYTFTMPESDTELNILYEKVLSEVVTDPTQATINIVQTRTGDRKNPLVTWKITDENGHTLANNITRNKTEGSAITQELLSNDDVTSVSIGIIFNSVSLDNKVMWTVDDPTLINTTGTDTGYTQNQAKIKPEVTEANSWLVQILSEAETAQKNANYTTSIPSTVHDKKAVLTATTDPDHSVDNKPVYAHCDVLFNFQIVDNTTLQAEGVSLDKNALTVNVERKLTGARRAPTETWTVTGLQSLKATLTPEESYVRSVEWEMTGDAATSLIKTASGEYDHDLSVKSVFDGSNVNTLADWMKELYDADNAAKAADKNYVMNKSGSKTATIKVTATDKQKGVHTDTCTVTVNYITTDTTSDVNKLNTSDSALSFTVTRKLSGLRSNPSDTYVISSGKKVSVSLSDGAPFLEDVLWETAPVLSGTIASNLTGTHKSENLITVGINTGNVASFPAWIYNVINADNAAWNNNKSTIRNGSAQISGYITAKSNDVTLPNGTNEYAKTLVTITFKTEDSTYTSTPSGGGGGGGGGTGGGGGSAAGGPSTGSTGATYSPNWFVDAKGVWRIKNSKGQIVTNAWLCDDVIPANGKNVWYLLAADGSMVISGLVQDNTGNFYSIETNHTGYYGMLRYKNGYYDCNGQKVYLTFHQEHDGSFGAITNADGIEKLKAIYGVTKFAIGNNNAVYTASF